MPVLTEVNKQHSIHDKVYVRDDAYGWLPANIMEVEDDRILVCIQLPLDWDETTVISHKMDTVSSIKRYSSFDQLNYQHRWEYLSGYKQRRLPCRNAKPFCRDIVTDLEFVHEAEVLYQIKGRYTRTSQNPYTRIGDLCLLAVGGDCPSHSGLYSIDRQKAYARKYGINHRDSMVATKEEKKENDIGQNFNESNYSRSIDLLAYEPHIYELSSLAYRNTFIQSKECQVILISGVTNSGKSQTSQLLLHHLISMPRLLSTDESVSSFAHYDTVIERQKNGNEMGYDLDLPQKINLVSLILQSFGNAGTDMYKSSSRFGKVTHIQYARNPRQDLGSGQPLVGFTTNTYLVETSRIVNANSARNGRNFNIFYQFLASSEATKEILLGNTWQSATFKDFKILLHDIVEDSDILNDDSNNWEVTKNAMKVFCWDDASLKTVVQCLGVVLRLGNITFDINTQGDVFVSSQTELNTLALEIGVKPADLEFALIKNDDSTNSSQSDKNKKTTNNPLDEAINITKSVAKMVYSCLFSSIIRQLNYLTSAISIAESSLKPSNNSHSTDENEIVRKIAVLDVIGFDICNDTTKSMRFQQFCTNYVAEILHQKYIQEILGKFKIDLDQEGIDYPDFKELDNSSTIDLLEGVPQGIISTLDRLNASTVCSSEMILLEIKNSIGKHHKFVDVTNKAADLGIRHFTGSVNYDVSDFVEMNREYVPGGIVALFTKSTNKILSQEFGRMLSIRAEAKTKHYTTLTRVSQNLKEMVSSLENCEVHHVRCIAPSLKATKLRQFQHEYVLQQIRVSGLVNIVDLSKNSFPHKMGYEYAEKRFQTLLEEKTRISIAESSLHDRVQIMLSILFASFIEDRAHYEAYIPFACGKNKIFLQDDALNLLETKRERHSNLTATKIQRIVRQRLHIWRLKRFEVAILLLQGLVRGKKYWYQYQIMRQSIIKIQASVRTMQSRRNYSKEKHNVILIQAWLLPKLQRILDAQTMKAATKIVLWRRQQKYRNQIVRERWLATMVPILLDAVGNLRCYDSKKQQKLVKATQNSYNLFSHRIPFHLLEERFACLIPENSLLAMHEMHGHDKAQLMMLILFAPFIDVCQRFATFPMPFVCGASRVYFRSGSLEVLEIMRREHYTIATIRIQRCQRGSKERRIYLCNLKGVRLIQKVYRSRIAKLMTLSIAALVHVLKQINCFRPAYMTALLKSRINATKLFPYVISHSVAIKRFACLLSLSTSRLMTSTDEYGRTKHMMPRILEPFMNRLRLKLLPMPYFCTENGVFLRVGSLEVLEILRKEKMKLCTIKIQSTIRMKLSRIQAKYTINAILLQSFYRKRKAMRLHAAIKIQTEWHHSRRHNAVKLISSIWRRAKAKSDLRLMKANTAYKTSALLTSHAPLYDAASQEKKSENDNKKINATETSVALRPATQCMTQDETSSQNSIPNCSKARNGSAEEKSPLSNPTTIECTSTTNGEGMAQKSKSTKSKTNEGCITQSIGSRLRSKHTVRSTESALNATPSLASPKAPFMCQITDNTISSSNSENQSKRQLMTRKGRSSLMLQPKLKYSKSNAVSRTAGCVARSTKQVKKSSSIRCVDANGLDSVSGFPTVTNTPERKKIKIDAKTNNQSKSEPLPAIILNCKDKDAAVEDNVLKRSARSSCSSLSSDKGSVEVYSFQVAEIALDHARTKVEYMGKFGHSDSSMKPEGCREFVRETASVYQDQCERLRHDIIQITTEAQIQKQEMEAEYEERLAAYEIEVLQLQRTIKSLSDEATCLHDSISNIQGKNQINIKNLKDSMLLTEECHRKSLEQVMISVEKSKMENARALDALVHSRDLQIKQLENTITKMNKEETRLPPLHNTVPHSEYNEESKRLSLKLEKIVSSQHIMKLVEKYGNDQNHLKIAIEEKVSYKARNIAGRMERMIRLFSGTPQTINVMTAEAEGEIQQLEQQLEHAYEAVERLEKELSAFDKTKNKKTFRRLGFY